MPDPKWETNYALFTKAAKKKMYEINEELKSIES